MEEMREVTPEEIEAIRALEAKGIKPTFQAVTEWIAQKRRNQEAPNAGQGGRPSTLHRSERTEVGSVLGAPRKVTPEFLEALADLKRQGIPATERAVTKWIAEHAKKPGQVQRPPEAARANPEASAAANAVMAPFTPAELEQLCPPEPKPASRSLLVAAGLTTPKGGRPPKDEPWLEDAAKLVAGGKTLREALDSLGVRFTEQQLNNFQRRVQFRHYLDKYRQGR